MAAKPPLTEDLVEYFLFPELPNNKSEVDTERFLKEQRDVYLAHLSHFLVGYIWQKGGFVLTPSVTNGNLPCLKGTTNFGDNIEDEWFIVHILLELTNSFPGLTVRVTDNDGEFLLIEAANVLPKWLNPESGEDRVYLHNGDIHIIPMPQSTHDQNILPLFTPTTQEAIVCIRNHGNITRAADPIQKCIKKRLEKYPGCIRDNFHYSNCYIPAVLAAILDECPSLIAAGVRTFYYRDPIDLKACRTMRYFRPGTRVLHKVKFTRCLYSQLVGQRFQPDRRSGWIMPPATHKDFRAHDLGMKLAHGFEILCSHSSTNQNGATDDDSTMSDSDVRWNKFVQNLKDNGYFRNQLEGSSLYKSLLKDAHKFYAASVSNNDHSASPGHQVLSLLNTVTYDLEAMRKTESSLTPSDDESWMEIKQEDLDQLLAERTGFNPEQIDDKKLAESMKAFVNNVSSHEGAEYPGEMEDGADVQTDGLGFIHSMQKMFEFQDESGDSDSSSGIDEYDWTSDDERNKKKMSSAPKAPVNKNIKQQNKNISNSQINKPTHNKVDSKNGTQPSRVDATKNMSKNKGEQKTVEDFMEMMDRELANTTIGKSFETKKPVAPPRRKRTANRPADRDIDREDDGFRPVDIDANAVKNMLASYSAQQGMPGPASSLLGGMGLRLGTERDGDMF